MRTLVDKGRAGSGRQGTRGTGTVDAVSVDCRLTLRELRRETMEPLLLATCAAGILLVFGAHFLPDTQQAALLALVLMVTPLLVRALEAHSYLAGSWLLVASWMSYALAVLFWLPDTAAGCLLVLPVALAALFISPGAGVLVGLGADAAMTARALIGGRPQDALVYAVLIGGVLFTAWLSTRPTEKAVLWSWQSYDQARQQLELARDRQAELKQAVKDLADANLQMGRLNQLLGAARRAAEEAERIKAEFVANVSHELRTPLNMIIGYSEMIMGAPHTHDSRLPPALLADLAVIHRNGQHLSSLIDDVLDLSQVEAGRMALARERVAVGEIIAAAVEAVRPLYTSKGLELRVDTEQSLPLLFCDRTRIREVVLNLLSNAGRFSERGGVRVCAQREGNEIVVSVADTGPGIAPADRDRIFRPFGQLDGSIRRRYGGTGLGLSISRSFVELHGGRMYVESQVGLGTKFFFHLPIDPPAPAEGAATRWLSPHWEYRERARHTPMSPVAVRPRLVVLDRERALARLVARYMDGKEIVHAGSLEEAVREATALPAEALLINDASVSRGLERLQESQVLPPETPAIICSIPGMREAAQALGASDYLIKPVTQESLLAAVDRLRLAGDTVLVVDDEPEASRLLLRMFAAAGRRYRILRATDGEQALHILRAQRPDVMLLDLVMPGMDGFRLLQAKSEDPELQDIPVVVISARDPAGEPIVTSALAVTRAGGLSVFQMLACIEGLTRSLSAVRPPVDPMLPGTPPG